MSTLQPTESTEALPSVTTRYPQRNLAACMLPWTENYRLDVPAFEEHIQQAIDGGYQSMYLMGTAGEGYALTDTRFREVVEIFAAKTVRDGLDPQIGVIALSMEQIIERIGFAYDRGIRMFQISLPAWGALDEAEILVFFQTVCGNFPDCRFLHYNLPRTKRVITGAEYRPIVDRVPNLVATKNSTTDYARTADLMTHVPELQHFFLEGSFAMGCTLGECSLLCSYSVLFPQTSWNFFEAGKRKDLAELFRITKIFRDVDQKLFVHCHRSMIDGSYDKTFIWLHNSKFSNRMLPPYIGLSEEESHFCRQVYEENYADMI
ncbi:MAG: dihydrodipicolinate synthase family protein [Pirellulales bacterium]